MTRAVLAGALAALLALTAGAAAPPAGVTGILGTPADAGFAQALAPRRFEFPADHGPHPQFRQEWWYFTGNLEAGDGERFGFEFTVFRYALAPPGATPAGSSAWRARELYLAHFAVTDVARGRFASAQRLERGALGLAGATASPFAVWVDDWSVRAVADVPGSWVLGVQGEGYRLALELDASGVPVLNGERGLSVKSDTPGDASYYYSLPRVGVRGQLLRGGRTLQVTGLAWFDREWGSGGLGTGQVGWDWYALQLQDGSSLMFYALRRADGTPGPHSAGTFVEPSGEVRALTGADLTVGVGDHWVSATGTRYPSAWRISVPALGLELAVHPVLAAQELATTPRYWEGAVDATGTRSGSPVRGRGYVELVGYAKER